MSLRYHGSYSLGCPKRETIGNNGLYGVILGIMEKKMETTGVLGVI